MYSLIRRDLKGEAESEKIKFGVPGIGSLLSLLNQLLDFHVA